MNESPPSVRKHHAGAPADAFAQGKPADGHLPPPAQTRAGGESRSPAADAPTSRYAKPKVLMGEVAAPKEQMIKGQMIAARREAFRAVMLARHLRPTEWAAKAGVPAGEILAFLTGRSRSLSPGVVEKLAAAAGVAIEDLSG